MLQPTPISEDRAPTPEPMTPLARPPEEIRKVHVEVPRKTYTFIQCTEACEEYFHGDELAANIFVTKYALQNGKGEYLERSPDDMHRRLAREFARIEAKYANPMNEQEIYNLLDRYKYIVPQGSPMSGIGNDFKLQSLSNCFVINSPADSYGGVLWTDQQQAQIMKRRGGVGFDISTIRPKGMPTANAAVTTDGIEVFMDRYSNTCREVAQGGRRGALMLTIDVHHPQVRDFVKIKRDRERVTGANCSVRLSDEFLEAVDKNEKFQLRWPVEPDAEHVVDEWVDARELWDEIMVSAHDCAEPGLLFWGNAKKYTPSDIYEAEGFGSTSTNPCGEIILSPNDSCRLTVVNLTSFVEKAFTDEVRFNWESYGTIVQKAQRLMDDLIDLEIEQVDKIIAKVDADPESAEIKSIERKLWVDIRSAAVNGRRTGLGVTGVGDAVAMMGLSYGSDEGVAFIEEMYRQLAVNSYTSSILMAKERGAFSVCDVSKEKGHPFIERIKGELRPEVLAIYEEHGRRNIANTTTAPCGSVSTQTQTTSGIEPVPWLKYTRRKKINPNDEAKDPDFVDKLGDKWVHFNVLHHGFEHWCEVNGRDIGQVLERMGRGDFIDVQESPYWKATSADIDWTMKVKAQAGAQRWIDHAISNTTNLPADATVELVNEVYMTAWKSGCKGATVYREGSRIGVLVQDTSEFQTHEAPKRPERLKCEIHRSRIREGDEYIDWIILVGLFDGKPYEIFGGFSENIEIPKKIDTGWIVKRSPDTKKGGKYDLYYGDEDDPSKIKNIVTMFDNPNRGVFTRMISLSMRHGSPVQYVVEQLGRGKDSDMYEFSKVVARVLKKYIPDGTKSATFCPDCEAEGSMVYQQSCLQCSNCGWEKCS